ncbi:MAG: methylated-DNA--[protein]-cysteine S-methyltransferase [Anaerolineae bacterium]|nr:methylated-DNA--[protein]-cysteine S-methyltransferase [Anaerolineae bacterium]
MTTQNYDQAVTDYARIEQAILFLEKNFRRQPSLKEIADSVGLSEYHFQRLFTRWAGLSPKRFLQYLSVNYAKTLLAETSNLLDVTYETGLSSPGRLHDLFVTYEALTPGEFKKKGAGLTIHYGFHPTPFGCCLLAVTERGICGLTFVAVGEREAALNRLQGDWPQATLVEDSAHTQPFIAQIFASEPAGAGANALKLYVSGTNFQVKVWEALLKIPPGTVVAYDTVAELIGQPAAVRAVGGAAKNNPIGFLIPCHRVIRKVGDIGGYRWGTPRKKAILGWEAARREGQLSREAGVERQVA